VRDLPPHTVITTMRGGLLGTLGQRMCVDGVVPLMAGHALDRAALGGPLGLGPAPASPPRERALSSGVSGPAALRCAGSAPVAGAALGRVPLVGP
jgi:hypothetical protein